MKELEDLEGSLRVWHNSNPGHVPFQRQVASVEEALLALDVLSTYDLYLGDLVAANAQGLEIFEAGQWVEFHDEEGLSVGELLR